MPYLSLPNFNHDSGPRRIQSGPDHEGYVVLYSGVQSTGPDEGIVVAGSPLSGTLLGKAWDYDSNWRYVPSTLPDQDETTDATPYNASGALDTYDGARIYTRYNVAGAQAASAIGPETGKVNPRGGALQARSDVTRPETYMYYGGAAPDNQDYSPYNTPDANSAAEGKTGGGVTHRSFESSLLTNVLGSQGTSDRSQWRYHQPVYCKTYTETRRSETPGLMSTPLRYVYRGPASSYNYNYGSELLANKGGFNPLNYDDFGGGCDIPLPDIQSTGSLISPQAGDILTAGSFCSYESIEWFNTDSADTPIGTGETYTIQESDYFKDIYFVVTYERGTQTSNILSAFRPSNYRFGRWNGISWSNGWFAFPAVISGTTGWIDITGNKNLRVDSVRMTGATPVSILPWTSCVTYRQNPPSTGGVSSAAGYAQIYIANADESGRVFVRAITSNGVDPSISDSLMQNVKGVWQFSNDASGVLASWLGRKHPAFEPNAGFGP